MSGIITDYDIENLINENKIIPYDFSETFNNVKIKGGHKEHSINISGESGSDFRVVFRQSKFNQFDFSVILMYSIPKSNRLFRLKRYNGKSHEHENHIERDGKIYAFHIHTATQRYQEYPGLREDGYAEVSERYSDHHKAFQCMINDCNMVFEDGTKPVTLLEWD